MLECLDDIPLEQIQRYVTIQLFYFRFKTFCRFVNRSACFIFAYCQGLSNAQAAWANKKYHGHCIFSLDIIVLVKETIPK